MSQTTFLKKIKHFVHNKDGASGIEYAILAAIVAAALVTVGPTFGVNLTAAFDKVAASIAKVN
ncbi:Flp family type IVb pilin [Pseudomonas sp. LS1212]|uniref:Flp family type IVb pilin n=1 Tax=Pseudomonas sp. LS1212 TaxID=2972478 RepID=UPI00215CE706|nr:Flp family type IVb pilin [Pseudomonas sp. LS1212]UVJ44577.1 Flp family type IVb pilin [Pseudomonas sp. LS1212]